MSERVEERKVEEGGRERGWRGERVEERKEKDGRGGRE